MCTALPGRTLRARQMDWHESRTSPPLVTTESRGGASIWRFIASSYGGAIGRVQRMTEDPDTGGPEGVVRTPNGTMPRQAICVPG